MVPARDGSKGIPGKNIKKLGGKPLISYTIDCILSVVKNAHLIVATDSEDIQTLIKERYEQICVYRRSDSSASDQASVNLLVREVIEAFSLPDDARMIIMQATTPFFSEEDLKKCIAVSGSKTSGSTISCTRIKRFVWDDNGPKSYQLESKPRRQDFAGTLIENGRFYSFCVGEFIKSGNILNNPVSIVETSPLSFFEIDEPLDWKIAEAIVEYQVGR